MVYVFCLMVRCEEIGSFAIKTYHMFNTHHLHIFCGSENIHYIPEHNNQTVHIIKKGSEIYNSFNSGHLGTANIFAKAIYESPFDKIIHFDSDVAFRSNIVDRIVELLDEYDIVGPPRPYRYNANNNNKVRHYSDVTQTFCFGFKKSKLGNPLPSNQTLVDYCRGKKWKHSILDFFDPCSFLMLNNGAKIYHIDPDFCGGISLLGSNENKYGKLNKYFDIGDGIIHFAGIGSGYNFYRMKMNKSKIIVPETYVNWSIKKYDLYSRLVLGRPVLNDNESTINSDEYKQFEIIINNIKKDLLLK